MMKTLKIRQQALNGILMYFKAYVTKLRFNFITVSALPGNGILNQTIGIDQHY